jgi:ribosomal protein S18 acetylase RimI-like enzyme
MKNELNYRNATVEDAELLIKIYNAAFYEDYIKYGTCPAYGKSVIDMRKSITEFPKTVIEYNEVPVGVLSVKDNGDNKYYTGCLCVVPEYQRKGIGSEAVKYAKNYYNDWKEFSLVTPLDKIQNIEFYVNKCGFVIDRIEMDGTVRVAHFVLERKTKCV